MHSKKIYLMRHAHSEAQDCKRKGIPRDDDSLLDCHITKLGEFQAKTAWVEDDLPDLVVVSPLTRAIQTALIAFEGFDIPMICHPGLKEKGTKLPENIRREKCELIRDKKLNQHEAFADIDFSLVLEEKVWSTSKKSKRVNFVHDSLIEWLKRRKEERILLVTHYKVIKDLFPTGFEEVDNCKVFETNLFEGDYYLIKSGLI
uniref:Histidine phosphatase family protein n=1 Tax=viral metagenome TaxID=1070528 RepID=A0A6C0FB90_9ZZZZ